MSKNKNKLRKAEESMPKQASPAIEQAPKAIASVQAVPKQKLPEVEKVDFDAWHTMRAGRIPKHHHKEIIKADFKARGLGQCESLENFDEALKKYGIKLS